MDFLLGMIGTKTLIIIAVSMFTAMILPLIILYFLIKCMIKSAVKEAIEEYNIKKDNNPSIFK